MIFFASGYGYVVVIHLFIIILKHKLTTFTQNWDQQTIHIPSHLVIEHPNVPSPTPTFLPPELASTNNGTQFNAHLSAYSSSKWRSWLRSHSDFLVPSTGICGIIKASPNNHDWIATVSYNCLWIKSSSVFQCTNTPSLEKYWLGNCITRKHVSKERRKA